MKKQIDPGRALRSLARVVSWHRRKLAVIAAVLAVLTGINAAAPRPAETITVLRAGQLLPGGSPITESQLRLEAVPIGSVPEDALTDPGQALGRIVSAPVPKGQVLTGYDLVGERSLRPGRVLAPVRLSDPGLAVVLRPGDVIDIVASDGQSGAATIVAREARVVTIPAMGESIGRSDTGSGVLLLVEVDGETATALARAAGTSSLTVIWSS